VVLKIPTIMTSPSRKRADHDLQVMIGGKAWQVITTAGPAQTRSTCDSAL
jgi:hypothetical protein